MMTRNDLYNAAFRYKKAGLWKKLWDNEIFAIRLSSGETAYVCVMGKNGNYCALALYIGEESFQCLRDIANLDMSSGNMFRAHEVMVSQNSLHLALENKEHLSNEEVDETRAYAKANGISLRGKNAFPQFIKYVPNFLPRKVIKESDIAALCEAMEAAILLSELLNEKTPAELNILNVNNDTKQVSLFEISNQTLKPSGFAILPPDKTKIYAKVVLNNDILVERLKRLNKKGIWEAELVRYLSPVVDDEKSDVAEKNDNEDAGSLEENIEAAYFPLHLFIVESKSFYLLPKPMFLGYKTPPEELLQKFGETWISQGYFPREIRCREQRTFALLEDICQRVGTRISLCKGPMSALDDVLEHMYYAETNKERPVGNHSNGRTGFKGVDSLGGEDDITFEDWKKGLDMVIEVILASPKEALTDIPEDLVTLLGQVIQSGILSDDVSRKLRKKLKGIL